MYIPQCIHVYALALFCSCVVFVLLFSLFCGLAVHAKFDSTVFSVHVWTEEKKIFEDNEVTVKQLFDQKNLLLRLERSIPYYTPHIRPQPGPDQLYQAPTYHIRPHVY